MTKTISQDYLDLQCALHENPHYGVASLSYAPIIEQVCRSIGAHSVSDYGAGKCNLKVGLEKYGLRDLDYFPYDPVFPNYGEPKPADLVCCIDVLEHIEEEFLPNVIEDLVRITRNIGFFTVATGPAQKVLADGRNAHLIQKPAQGFWFVVRPLSSLENGRPAFEKVLPARTFPQGKTQGSPGILRQIGRALVGAET